MNEERWARLEQLFDEGTQLPADERAAWLAALDLEPSLRDQLRGMLAADALAPQGDARLTRRFGDALGAGGTAQAGERLGPYRLLRPLGSGGMGVVWLAERADQQFEQQVAIKLIHGHAGSAAAQQLRHERQILAGLVHPNIARLLDGGETAQGQPWIAMEYVPGEPITQAAQRLDLPLSRRIELLRDLAHAVHHAHQRLIVHRDIKPANVLLREDGRALLLDFGIARLLDPVSRSAGATQPWFTPAYASPEQRRGDALSTATDVYALGLLLAELLTDAPPAPDAEGALAAPSTLAPVARRRALRGDLDRIVQRATAVEPERRYASAEALADDLQHHLAGRPVQAVPDSLRYRGGKLLRRHPLGATAALLAGVLLALAGWRIVDERNRAVRAEARAQREAVAAGAVTEFLIGLFRDADPEATRRREITPEALVDRARDRLAVDPAIDDTQRARLRTALGEIYVNLGQPEKGTAILQQALAGGDVLLPLERAAALMELAEAAEARQDSTEAARRYGEAAHLLRSEDAPLPLSEALAGLGLAWSRLDRNQEADRVLQEAIALQREHLGPDARNGWHFQVYRAEALFAADRRDEARALMDEAIAHLRALLRPDDLELVSALGFYAVLLRDSGESAAAEQVFLEILAQRQSVLARDSQRIALVHNNLGRVYYDQGRTLEAVAQYQAAFDIGSRHGAERDPARAIDHMNLASLYEEISDYTRAEPLMRRGVEILEARAADVGFLLPMGRQNLGRLLMLAGQAEEARRWLERPIDAKPDKDWAMERGRQRVHLADWHRRYGEVAAGREWIAQAEANLADIGGPGSPRVAAIERVRGLLAARAGDFQTARRDLESASARLAKVRGERYVGVGELALELADLARQAGDPARARDELGRARAILDPLLATDAPQRARMAALAAALQ